MNKINIYFNFKNNIIKRKNKKLFNNNKKKNR